MKLLIKLSLLCSLFIYSSLVYSKSAGLTLPDHLTKSGFLDHGGILWDGEVKVIEIPEEVTVDLTQDEVILADRLIINGVIRTAGYKLDILVREIEWGKNGKITAFGVGALDQNGKPLRTELAAKTNSEKKDKIKFVSPSHTTGQACGHYKTSLYENPAPNPIPGSTDYSKKFPYGDSSLKDPYENVEQDILTELDKEVFKGKKSIAVPRAFDGYKGRRGLQGAQGICGMGTELTGPIDLVLNGDVTHTLSCKGSDEEKPKPIDVFAIKQYDVSDEVVPFIDGTGQRGGTGGQGGEGGNGGGGMKGLRSYYFRSCGWPVGGGFWNGGFNHKVVDEGLPFRLFSRRWRTCTYGGGNGGRGGRPGLGGLGGYGGFGGGPVDLSYSLAFVEEHQVEKNEELRKDQFISGKFVSKNGQIGRMGAIGKLGLPGAPGSGAPKYSKKCRKAFGKKYYKRQKAGRNGPGFSCENPLGKPGIEFLANSYDLIALNESINKIFENRYNDSLIGVVGKMGDEAHEFDSDKPLVEFTNTEYLNKLSGQKDISVYNSLVISKEDIESYFLDWHWARLFTYNLLFTYHDVTTENMEFNKKTAASYLASIDQLVNSNPRELSDAQVDRYSRIWSKSFLDSADRIKNNRDLNQKIHTKADENHTWVKTIVRRLVKERDTKFLLKVIADFKGKINRIESEIFNKCIHLEELIAQEKVGSGVKSEYIKKVLGIPACSIVGEKLQMISSENYPYHDVQLRYKKMAYELKGDYPEIKISNNKFDISSMNILDELMNKFLIPKAYAADFIIIENKKSVTLDSVKNSYSYFSSNLSDKGELRKLVVAESLNKRSFPKKVKELGYLTIHLGHKE